VSAATDTDPLFVHPTGKAFGALRRDGGPPKRSRHPSPGYVLNTSWAYFLQSKNTVKYYCRFT
jgi:hypothetical protein